MPLSWARPCGVLGQPKPTGRRSRACGPAHSGTASRPPATRCQALGGKSVPGHTGAPAQVLDPARPGLAREGWGSPQECPGEGRTGQPRSGARGPVSSGRPGAPPDPSRLLASASSSAWPALCLHPLLSPLLSHSRFQVSLFPLVSDVPRGPPPPPAPQGSGWCRALRADTKALGPLACGV